MPLYTTRSIRVKGSRHHAQSVVNPIDWLLSVPQGALHAVSDVKGTLGWI